MQEIYRSFEGKLDMSNQSGYIVYQIENGKYGYQIESLSIDSEKQEPKIRIMAADAPKDWTDLTAIGELIDAVDCGRIPGQMIYKEHWITPRNIMDDRQDYNWKKYC